MLPGCRPKPFEPPAMKPPASPASYKTGRCAAEHSARLARQRQPHLSKPADDLFSQENLNRRGGIKKIPTRLPKRAPTVGFLRGKQREVSGGARAWPRPMKQNEVPVEPEGDASTRRKSQCCRQPS